MYLLKKVKTGDFLYQTLIRYLIRVPLLPPRKLLSRLYKVTLYKVISTAYLRFVLC